jgi:glutamate/tyrosine decarboxylase-like PLP-dependent enzyme
MSRDDLDPDDWGEVRRLGHAMLDEMFDYVEGAHEGPVWRPVPQSVRDAFRAGLPQEPSGLAEVHEDFRRLVVPYATGNVHPGFMGWVHGGGTVVGMLAEMLAGGLNCNLGGRDQAGLELERQIVLWARELFRFPESASGVLVTGSSAANLYAVLVARRRALGESVREAGLSGAPRLVAYSSAGAHGCIPQAMDAAGLGRANLRLVGTDARHRIEIAQLKTAIAADRAAGAQPFLVIGTAGTVDTGAIDDLVALADLCREDGLWFHVDGAFGALGMLAPEIAPRLEGLERADSIAVDFHKWGQVPYDAALFLARDGALHLATFAAPNAYLRREPRGLAAGSPWPCDYGLELSRGFRALKVWMTLRVYGGRRLGRSIARTCALGQYLRERISREPALELMAPVELNIVCFRHRGADPDRLNAEIVADLHESGIAVPSTTLIGGALAIRAAIVNHRTAEPDLDRMVDGILARGRARLGAPAA